VGDVVLCWTGFEHFHSTRLREPFLGYTLLSPHGNPRLIQEGSRGAAFTPLQRSKIRPGGNLQ